MDFGKLVARVSAILTTPKTEWPVIAGEPTTVADLYKNYLLIMAAIPAVFGFIRQSLIGVSIPSGGTFRLGIGAGLASMILSYVLALAMIYVAALITNALALTFGGQKNQIQALKAIAYAYTASFVAGIGQVVPWLGLLIGLAGAVYSIYLLYLGLPHTMQCPQERATGYTATIVIIAFVLSLAVGAVIGLVISFV